MGKTYSPREYNGITEDKILEETDVETLLGWKEELNGCSLDIEIQLNQARAKKEKDEPYDVDWFYRAKGKKHVVGYLSQVVQNTIGIVRRNQNKQEQLRREKLFIEEIKKIISKEEFLSIWRKVDELIDKEVEG